MTAPSVAYGQLAPMLIVFGVAVVGVLVEAFLPRKLRYRAQLSLSLAGLFVALIWVLRVTLQLRGGIGNSVVAGAVDIDRPTLFLWATILLIGVLSVLLIAERRAESPRARWPWTPSHRTPRPCRAAWPRRWPPRQR